MTRRRVGIKDVAARAGVSIGTVSNVLNQPETVSDGSRRAVQAVIDELGFVRNGSAAQLRSARRTVVGLVVLDVGNPFFTEVVRGAEMALEERGYTVLVCNSDGDRRRQEWHLRFLEEQQVAGVLVIPVDHRRDRHHLARLRERGLSATDRIRQGRDRGEGLRRAVARTGNDAGVTVAEVPVAELNGNSGYAVVDGILARQPDAIFCANDLVALGVLRGLFERGVSVPDDVVLVGFDDIDFAQLASVPLTSVRQPASRIGQAAAGLLVEEATEGGQHRHQGLVFGPELVVRRSTDPGAVGP